MAQTPNLLITEIAANQNQKEVTANTAFLELEGALTDLVIIATADANVTLTTAEGGQALDHMCFSFTGALTAGRNIVVPTNKKLYAVNNACTGGFSLTVKTPSGTGVALAASTTYTLLYCDGTNVVAVAASVGGTVGLSNGGTGVDLSAAGGANFVLKMDAGHVISAGLLVAGDIPTSLPATFATKTGSYTLVLGDAGTIVRMNVGSANNLTVPPNSSVAFPLGTSITVRQIGAGQTTIDAGGGVTINTPSSLDIRLQQGSVVLVKVATDEWDLYGDTA